MFTKTDVNQGNWKYTEIKNNRKSKQSGNSTRSFIIVLFLCFNLVQTCIAAQVSAMNLRCEYLVNPLGIDERNPRLSWIMQDERQGARQSAFQVLVSTDSLDVLNENGDQWNTGKIASSLSLIKYQGKALQPFTKYYWTVVIWDMDGVKAEKLPVASFETGMMDQHLWKGAWISDVSNIQLRSAPYFRKSFELTGKIRSARVYLAVAGLYELYLNGRKVGNQNLDPAYTRYDRRTLYVVHDVTTQLQEGKNALGIVLGNGWYNLQSTAVWYFDKAPWRARPAFCLDMRVTYEDGTVQTICSGKDWKTSLGPIIFNSIYTGEHYDANKAHPGWSTAGFVDTAWKQVMYRAAPSLNVVAQSMPPVRCVEEVKTKSIHKINDTTFVFNLGRNISGISRLKLSGPKGTQLRLKHGERLDSNGRVDISNIDVHYRPTDKTDPFQTDIFILSGKGEEEFMPLFNYKGFQYVEVISSRPISLTKESLTAFFMHSDLPVVGHIKSSNPVIDKIWAAANNSYLSNFMGYPTDCPQREKNGWTGDAHIALETGLYNFDGISVYEKWMRDHQDEQQPNGVLPSIIPTGGWGYEWGNGPDWTSTMILIPWNIYLFYGDTGLLHSCYPNMRRYIEHINEQYPSGLTTWGLGDWVPVSTMPPVEFTSSTYYFSDVNILAKVARLLNKQDDADRYTTLASRIKDSINKKYLNKVEGIYGSGMQTELSFALYYGLVPEELVSKVAANLAKKVAADQYHLNVGLLGTKTILSALSDYGYADIAYKVAAQETFPSWGWWIKNGATTLYENWRLDANSDLSMNHIMFGAVSAWLYNGLGGIKPDVDAPGYEHFWLQPHFVNGLNAFEASYVSPKGRIISSWKKKKGKTYYDVVVPANTSATLTFSDSSVKQVRLEGKPANAETGSVQEISDSEGKKGWLLTAGTYHFIIK